jgi:hypothetical protein
MVEVKPARDRLLSPASALAPLSLCAVLLAPIVTSACRHVRPHETYGRHVPPVIGRGDATPVNPPVNSRVTFRLLSDGSLHRQEPPPRNAFYVVGYMEGDHFVAQGEVLGEGELAGDGHPGWMELADGLFYGDQTARTPTHPYVHGVRNAAGLFCPDSRVVVY